MLFEILAQSTDDTPKCQEDGCSNPALGDFLNKEFCEDHLRYHLAQAPDDIQDAEKGISESSGLDRLKYERVRQKIKVDSDKARRKLEDKAIDDAIDKKAHVGEDQAGHHLPELDSLDFASPALEDCEHCAGIGACYRCDGTGESPSGISCTECRGDGLCSNCGGDGMSVYAARQAYGAFKPTYPSFIDPRTSTQDQIDHLERVHGMGVQSHMRADPEGLSSYHDLDHEDMDCEECDGTGKTNGNPCEDCDGEGKWPAPGNDHKHSNDSRIAGMRSCPRCSNAYEDTGTGGASCATCELPPDGVEAKDDWFYGTGSDDRTVESADHSKWDPEPPTEPRPGCTCAIGGVAPAVHSLNCALMQDSLQGQLVRGERPSGDRVASSKVEYEHESHREAIRGAFKDLRKQGVWARMNFKDCNSCAGAAMPENTKKTGYVFYHSQSGAAFNCDRFTKCNDYHERDFPSDKLHRALYLSWWPPQNSEDDPRYNEDYIGPPGIEKEFGRRVVDTLERHGLTTHWGGSLDDTIQVEPAPLKSKEAPPSNAWKWHAAVDPYEQAWMDAADADPTGKTSRDCYLGNHSDCKDQFCGCDHHDLANEFSGACYDGDHADCKMDECPCECHRESKFVTAQTDDSCGACGSTGDCPRCDGNLRYNEELTNEEGRQDPRYPGDALVGDEKERECDLCHGDNHCAYCGRSRGKLFECPGCRGWGKTTDADGIIVYPEQSCERCGGTGERSDEEVMDMDRKLDRGEEVVGGDGRKYRQYA